MYSKTQNNIATQWFIALSYAFVATFIAGELHFMYLFLVSNVRKVIIEDLEGFDVNAFFLTNSAIGIILCVHIAVILIVIDFWKNKRRKQVKNIALHAKLGQL